jgi:GNAT superfamily N-acetyltransferase
VKSESDLVAAAHDNFVASFRKLVEHCPEGEIREIGGVFTFVTGLPLSLFNGCVIAGPAIPADLEAALEWVRAQNLPHRVWIAQLVPELGDLPPAYGLDPEPMAYPGMVLHPLPEPPAPSAGVTVEPVTDANLEEYLWVCVAGGLRPDLSERLFSPSFTSDRDVQLFVGRLEGRPVGTSVAIRSSAASGVYNVGTLPQARQRGVGAALTWAAIEAGRAWGYDTIVLQSSAMGFSMYVAMGFRTVAPYIVFSERASVATRE